MYCTSTVSSSQATLRSTTPEAKVVSGPGCHPGQVFKCLRSAQWIALVSTEDSSFWCIISLKATPGPGMELAFMFFQLTASCLMRWLHSEDIHLCRGCFIHITMQFMPRRAGICRVLDGTCAGKGFPPKDFILLKESHQLSGKELQPARLIIPAHMCCQETSLFQTC